MKKLYTLIFPTPHFNGCVVAHPKGYDPQFELGRDFCTIHLLRVSSSFVYSFGSHRVDKHTNTYAETSNALRYATTLGNDTAAQVISRQHAAITANN